MQKPVTARLADEQPELNRLRGVVARLQHAWAQALAAAFAMAVGGLAGWILARPTPLFTSQLIRTALGLSARTGIPGAGFDVTSVSFMANLFVVVTYGLVGWYLADYQVRRFVAEGAWSLSGVSLSGVFFSCALMHLVYAMTIVKRVHSDSVVDWNRRPLVGTAAMPGRSSPWSGVIPVRTSQ